MPHDPGEKTLLSGRQVRGFSPAIDLWLSEYCVKITVRGDSMKPFLKDGDEVEVAAVLRDELQPGDLILFVREGTLTVHRFLAGGKERFLEKGDAQARGNWHPWPEKLGRVTAINRPDGWENLSTDDARLESLRLGQAGLLRHRFETIVERLPFSIVRRIAFRIGRPFIHSKTLALKGRAE